MRRPRKLRGRRVSLPPLVSAERVFLLTVALVTVLGTGIRRCARDHPAAFPGLVLSAERQADEGTADVPPRGARLDRGGGASELDRHIERVERAVARRTPGGGERMEPLAGPIDVNRVGPETLQRLPGVGPVLAARIREERSVGGPFTSVEDLSRVRGIGAQTVERLRPWVLVTREETPDDPAAP